VVVFAGISCGDAWIAAVTAAVLRVRNEKGPPSAQSAVDGPERRGV